MSAQTSSNAETSKGLTQVLIAGEAGQGSILCGVMLAETATKEGREVAQSARYGAAVRSGQAEAHVLISDSSIDFPHVDEPDYLIATAQSTYDKYAPKQAESTLVIYDPFFVKPKDLPGIKQYAIPATESAIQQLGKAQGANVILLSALAKLTGVISRQGLENQINAMPAKFRASNMQALEIGIELVAKAEEEKG
jgi:2-oxoglutarate ferredoxin oxidoreductase subunit gamma